MCIRYSEVTIMRVTTDKKNSLTITYSTAAKEKWPLFVMIIIV